MNPRRIVRLYEWYKAKTFCCAFFAAAMLTMVAAATIVRFPPVIMTKAKTVLNDDASINFQCSYIFNALNCCNHENCIWLQSTSTLEMNYPIHQFFWILQSHKFNLRVWRTGFLENVRHPPDSCGDIYHRNAWICDASYTPFHYIYIYNDIMIYVCVF